MHGGSGALAAGGGLFLSVTPAFILGLDGEYAMDIGLQSSLRLALARKTTAVTATQLYP